MEEKYIGARRIAKVFKFVGGLFLGLALVTVCILPIGMLLGSSTLDAGEAIYGLSASIVLIPFMFLIATGPFIIGCLWLSMGYILDMLADISEHTFQTGRLLYRYTSMPQEKKMSTGQTPIS